MLRAWTTVLFQEIYPTTKLIDWLENSVSKWKLNIKHNNQLEHNNSTGKYVQWTYKYFRKQKKSMLPV